MKVKGNLQSFSNIETGSYVVATFNANAYSITLAPAITAYTSGLKVRFQVPVGGGNTGAATLACNGLVAKSLKKLVTTDLSSGDLTALQIIEAVYDGTNFQILTMSSSGGGGGMTNPMTTTGDIIYGAASGTPTRLAGAAGFLKSTGAAAPAWSSVTKSDVGLANVENTALSTWAGSANITTLGTVTTGTWSATAVGATKGGTGLATYTLGDILYASAANTLSALAGNTVNAKRFLVQTGTGTVSAAPSWGTIAAGDVPTLNQNTTGSAGSISGTNVITNSNLSQMAASTIKGNNTAGTANAADLTATQVTAMLNTFAVSTKGLVPGPSANNGFFLRDDGTWASATSSGMSNPMTTTGDIIYGAATGTPTRLAGAAGFLKSTGAAAPAWSAIDLSSTDATGTLAAGRFPAMTGEVTNTAGSLSTTITKTITPSWTGAHTFQKDTIATTSTDAIVLYNATAATSIAQVQYSPRIRLTGAGWKTNATAASQVVDWWVENRPVAGTAAPSTNLAFVSRINAGTATDQMVLKSDGSLTVTGTIGASNFSGSSSGTNTGDQSLASLGAQAQLNGTGFVKASGTTISYDNSTYLTSLAHTHTFSNSGGTQTFTLGVGETVKFASSGATSVSFDTTNKIITFSSSDTDTNTYVTSASFNTTTGSLTLTRNDAGTVSVSLDGRYLTSNQSITLSSDVSGSGATAISCTVNGLKGAALPVLATGFLKYNGGWSFDSTTYYAASNPNGYTSNTGTVTSVSVATANGFSGSVATSTTTPSITISTSVGAAILKSNGAGGITAASAGTDYVVPSGSISGSAGSVANSATFNSGGTGAISGTTYNGSSAVTISYNTVGAAAASHTHAAGDITSGTMATARLGSGTASSSTYLRGDQTWATISSASPGGSTGYIQYNNASAFAGSANFTFDGTNAVLAGQMSASSFYQSSSLSVKKDIAVYDEDALSLIDQVNVVTFKYINDVEENERVGFIAEYTPERFSTRNKNVMDQGSTIGVLLKAIQQLKKEIEILKGGSN